MEKDYVVTLSVGYNSFPVRVCCTEEEADLVKNVVCRVLEIFESTRICVEWSMNQFPNE